MAEVPGIFAESSSRADYSFTNVLLVLLKFPSKILVEEQWLGAQFPTWVLEIGLGLLACAIIAVCAVLVMGAVAYGGLVRDRRRKDWHAVATVLCYLVPAAVFFDWWEPTNNEFWIAPWYAVVLLLGIMVGSREWPKAAAVVAFCSVILVLFNGLFGIYPRLDARSDYWLARQQAVARLANRDDLIVENGYMAGNYMEFVSDARVFRADFPTTLEMLQQAFKDTLDAYPATRSVYMTDLVTDTTVRSNPLNATRSNDEIIELFFKGLPPPKEWLTVDGRRLARYDAASLRAYLNKN